uniref:Pentraxin (PTX) domain-containing protein n=1 Tax=Hucho hucho TaxID=62062 RepID=A0A4W5MH05_9TELE
MEMLPVLFNALALLSVLGRTGARTSSPNTTPSGTVFQKYMRTRTQGKDLTLFSLTQGNYWNLLLETKYGMDRLSIDFSSQSFRSYRLLFSITEPRPWTSLCITWEKKTGVAQVWRDGTVSIRKRVSGQVRGEKFEGQVTDVEVWDSVLSQRWIMAYMSGWRSYGTYTPGNVLTWSKAIYSTNDVQYVPSSCMTQRSSLLVKHSELISVQILIL